MIALGLAKFLTQHRRFNTKATAYSKSTTYLNGISHQKESRIKRSYGCSNNKKAPNGASCKIFKSQYALIINIHFLLEL